MAICKYTSVCPILFYMTPSVNDGVTDDTVTENPGYDHTNSTPGYNHANLLHQPQTGDFTRTSHTNAAFHAYEDIRGQR